MTDPRDLALERLLVIRCQAGDDRAFEELVERFGPRLRYFLARLAGAGAEAEDLVQDVWIAVFRKIGALRSPAAFRSWLYRIARDRALGELRRRGREAAPEPLETDPAAEPEPEFGPEDAARIHAGLGRLTPEHREVLLLRFVEDMSYEEIAAVVGRDLGTVRSRLHYAKVALKRELERMERRDGR